MTEEPPTGSTEPVPEGSQITPTRPVTRSEPPPTNVTQELRSLRIQGGTALAVVMVLNILFGRWLAPSSSAPAATPAVSKEIGSLTVQEFLDAAKQVQAAHQVLSSLLGKQFGPVQEELQELRKTNDALRKAIEKQNSGAAPSGAPGS